MKKENFEIYKKGINGNIDSIIEIIKNLEMTINPPIDLFKQLLNKSSDQIIFNWSSGRKYSRTSFVQKSFENHFPNHLLPLFLSIDATVNILDDLLDEDMDKEKRGNYIVEILRNLPTYTDKNIPTEIRKSINEYFNKLIVLAVSEDFYKLNIQNEDNLDEIIKKSVSLLKCRAMDIDIFTDIALANYKSNNQIDIKNLNRLFRSLNIFKKDLLDIPYDKEKGMETIAILVLNRNKNYFQEYAMRIIDLINKEKRIIIDNNLDDQIIKNINDMMKEEEKKIIEISSSL